jgi:hypothetical protein
MAGAPLHHLHDGDDVEIQLDDLHNQCEVRAVAVTKFLYVPSPEPDGIADNNRVRNDLRPSLADETAYPVVENDGIPVRDAGIQSCRVARLESSNRC